MKKYIKIIFALFIIPLVFTSCSRDEPFVAPPPPPPVVNVVVNEIYSRGDTLNPDWIEIYNPGTTSKDISGYKIYDNGGQAGTKSKKVIPAGTVLAAGAYIAIVVDVAGDTTGFGLSSGGEKVWLENSAGSIIDSVEFPALGIDTSYGRNPNGSTNWAKLAPPTKAAANFGGTVVAVMMNEIYSRGIPTDPDWIEIFNPNSIAMDLSGYKIYDVGGNGGLKPKMVLPPGSLIPATGYLVVVTDSVGTASGFGLSSTGEEVWLENTAGSVIDDVVFPAMPDTAKSYGRIPNGSATWQLSTKTKGAPNQP